MEHCVKNKGIALKKRIAGVTLRTLFAAFAILISVFILKDFLSVYHTPRAVFVAHGLALAFGSGAFTAILYAAVGAVAALIFATVASRLMIGIAVLYRLLKFEYRIAGGLIVPSRVCAESVSTGDQSDRNEYSVLNL